MTWMKQSTTPICWRAIFAASDACPAVRDPEVGKVKQVGISVKLSETPGQIRFLAAPLGAHTEEILTSLGFSQEKIAELRGAGAIK